MRIDIYARITNSSKTNRIYVAIREVLIMHRFSTSSTFSVYSHRGQFPFSFPPVTRDLECSPVSIDYGLEVVSRRCFWVETEHGGFLGYTLEECIQHCENETCLQLVYGCPECKTMIPTRYNRYFSSQFVNRPVGSYTITRICIAGKK